MKQVKSKRFTGKHNILPATTGMLDKYKVNDATRNAKCAF
jgi:hypothetical protein